MGELEEWKIPALLSIVEAQPGFGYRKEAGDILRWRGSLRLTKFISPGDGPIIIINDPNIPVPIIKSLHCVCAKTSQPLNNPDYYCAVTLIFNLNTVHLSQHAPLAGSFSTESIINFDGVTYSI